MGFLQNDYFKQGASTKTSYNQKELSDVILALASGNIGEKEILQWIIEHQQ